MDLCDCTAQGFKEAMEVGEAMFICCLIKRDLIYIEQIKSNCWEPLF